MIAAVLAVNVIVVAVTPQHQAVRARVPYSPLFLDQLRAGNVRSITSQGETVQGELKRAISVPRAAGEARVTTRLFATEVPTFADAGQLSRLLEVHGVQVDAKPADTGRPFIETALLSIAPALLLLALIIFVMRRMSGGGLGGSAFARSRARVVDTQSSEPRITFADVAGIDEAEEELEQIVDFLRAPDKYRRLGARIPRGVLLTGPPGTGKTLLARALAGEARVPFFSIAASEFVELYVGVGASRVRSLFADAKRAAPAIVFVDELDAIGRSRSSGPVTGGHDEREQTLNQLLTELDGFDPSIGVIVMAATNRPEILDAALLRPGRFDRRIPLQPPSTAGRRRILDVHVRSVPLAGDVDLDRLASATTGMVGADLANVVNEGALLAARREHPAVTMDDLEDALEKLILGTERHIVLSAEERRRSAYHEAGHAIVGLLTPGADPVRKVSIIPRGDALGVTMSAPDADRFSYDRRDLEAKIHVALGGRVAEELVFDEVSTGAQADIKQVTDLARHMVGTWGMSERIGPVLVLADDDLSWHPVDGSPETARIVEESHQQVTALLTEHRDKLESLVAGLLEEETLDQDAAYAAAQVDPHEVPHASEEPTIA
jgi:cell division protease FtsH